MVRFKLTPAWLQCFGEGGGAAGGEGAPGGAAEDGGGDGGTVTLYGREAAAYQTGEGGDGRGSDAGSQQEQTPQEGEEKKESRKERMERFRALVDGEGEFADLYTREVQRAVDKRLSRSRQAAQQLQERLDAQQPVVDLLMQRYKIQDGDVSALAKAVEADDSYWSEAADQAGMSVEQYRQLQRLERENAALRQAQVGRQAQDAAREQMRLWLGEAEELRREYPDFDLEAFVREPRNVEYLKHHVPMRMIYEYANRDAIRGQVAAGAAQAAAKGVTDSVRANAARPKEGGVAGQSGVVLKPNVEELTNEDIDDIIRRVRQGERISF